MTKSERTRKQIVIRSASLFNEKGFAGSSVDEIVEKIDVTRRSLYKHFEGKEELAQEVVEYLLDETLAKTRSALKSGSAQNRLFAYLDLYQNPYCAGPVTGEVYINGGCPILNFGVEYDDGDPHTATKVARAVNETLKALESVILEGKNEKEFRDDIDVSQLALKIFSAIKGGILVARLLKNNNLMHQIISGLKQELLSYQES
ncbi:TetR/AcrR family transcriptional regulator [Dyadobacter frigoris]|uniref:TetR/AcrR family transcriptional regulator n=1 Tax=Dyadobacter frigoris TaxID=2576211 RepID=A0A4V6BJG6_9BACT|nr:TetR/AcrR family transcriptional regulator [Dyadobacter frigoris]TKT93373.1 TetR/AcrR family transcriptional regulator [Dyadobacter frigoris]GLU54686.1 transcriptional regulator [Dyadobacter frigoris]